MPLTAGELIEKCKDQRKRKRYEEALVSALAATGEDPDDADAWWQVALCRLTIGDDKNAIAALKKTVELAPEADNAWSRLGALLKKHGEIEEAKEAFLECLSWDRENLDALEGMSSIYADEDEHDQDEEEISVLERIEDLSYLSSFQSNRLGILHYRNKRHHEAIKYWQIDAASADHPASLFNLGLVYNHPEVSQDADAIDMWRLALRRFPKYEPPLKKIPELLPRMLQLARDARQQGITLLPQDQWHEHYLNPFQLLNPDSGLELEDFDVKTLQKLKKSLLQEIDLEDGLLPWVPGFKVDKSRAIGFCEELNDDAKREFHWHVYSNKALLEFLSKGAHEHFLVGDREEQLDTIEFLWEEENGFREWLSDLFAPQFDRVLSKAIEAKNLIVLECLLDGRRWVSPQHADRCFVNSRRVVDRLLQPLRDANERADTEKPTAIQVEGLLNRGAIVGVMNLLPSYFEDYQNEAVHQIRGIAVSCFNAHDDIDLSRNVIELAKRFRFRSADANRMIEEDVAQIEKLIKQERKHEAKLTSGAQKWEITKEGAKHGDRFIAAGEVTSVRWGAMITRNQSGEKSYDFLVVIGADDGRRINFSWNTTRETDRHQKHFQDLINAALVYLFPSLMERIEKQLANGRSLRIGPCTVTRTGVEFEVKGWIFTDTHTVPWHRTRVDMENGEVMIWDALEPKKRVAFSLRDTDNAPVLRTLVNIKNGQED